MPPTYEQLLEKVKTKLEAVLDADPAVFVDYRIGDKSVSKSQYVDHLLQMLEKLQTLADGQADIATMAFDQVISEFGEDLTEYI